jgi:dihydrofolate reductase
MKISIIAAVANSNLAIGKGNELLWYLPSDLKHFKNTTKGHTVLMGSKTYVSIGKPLPDRVNVILDNQNMTPPSPHIHIVDNIQAGIDLAQSNDEKELFVIGGACVYKQMLEMADKLYLTLVEGKFEGDVFFPEWRDQFEMTKGCSIQQENGIRFRFTEWERSL